MTEYKVMIDDNCTKWFNLEGKYHRENGPAIEWADGSKYWYLNGQLHRVDGPAVEWVDGSKEWWINGQRHRVDGPAVEWADGRKYWYMNGENYSEQSFNEYISKQNKPCLGKKVIVDGIEYELR